MKRHTENEIISLFKKDRDKAFRMFFDEYYIMLCDYALSMTDDFEDAEDIVQSFFIKFWEERLDESVVSNLKNYSLRCVRNAAIKKMDSSNLFLSLGETDDWVFESEEELIEEQHQVEKKLGEALDKLSVNEYNAIKSVIMDDKRYSEVAEELNISINTLKTYLKRAFKKLKESDLLFFLSFFVTHFMFSTLFMIKRHLS